MSSAWKAKVARYKKRQRPYRKKNLAKRVKRLEAGVEHKVIDTLIASSAFTTTASGTGKTVINLLPQGDSNVERDGDTVLITSVHLKLIFNADTASDNNMIRVMLVCDKQCNGVAADIDLVLTDTSAQDAMVAPRETQGRQRFHVYCDKIFRINKQGEDFQYVNIFKKLNLKVNYGLAQTGNITDIASNALLLYVFGFNALGTWQGIIRCNFIDG